MDKVLVMKIKEGDIEVEVQGDCEEVKEQFAKAVEAVKEIHHMKIESGKAVTEDLQEKMLEPLLKMLK